MLGAAPVSTLPVSTLPTAGAAFDAALMAAIHRPWRDIIFSPGPLVIASGMTPPAIMPN